MKKIFIMAYICDNSNNQSHKVVDNVSYTFVASTALVLQMRQNEKSRFTRDFHFCLLGLPPQTPKTEISSPSCASKRGFFTFVQVGQKLQFLDQPGRKLKIIILRLD